MPCCALRYCKTRYDKTIHRDFSLFSFPPTNNEEWVQFVRKDRGEENWLPSSSSRLCSKHFKKEDVCFGKTGRAVLKKGSVPLSENEIDDSIPDRATPISIAVSDSESIFDTPRKISLKAQVRRLQNQKLQHQLKIKKLGHQNRYLKQKVYNLQKLTNHLANCLTAKKAES